MANIKSERIRKGMTQKTLAKRLDVDERTVSNWENESTPVPSTKAVKMSDIFGCSVDYLFGLSDERKTVA